MVDLQHSLHPLLPSDSDSITLLSSFLHVLSFREVCNLKTSILDVPGSLAEDLGDLLLAEGAISVAVEEFRPEGAPEEKIFANNPSSSGTPEKRVWERCTVTAYFPPEIPDAKGVATVCTAALGLPPLSCLIEPVRAQDWEAAIKESYQPVEIASGLWIVPTWAQPVNPEAINLILEPGLAFGTGDHPTTRLCLCWLRTLKKKELQGARVMDYGTGSGILAVGALLLGAGEAVGTDVEPLAVRSAQQNALLNKVDGAFAALQCGADLDAPEPLEEAGVPPQKRLFEVVVANILRGPLVELAPRLAGYAAPGAVLGLSGILETQAPEVIEAYSPWFENFRVEEQEAWALVTATRKCA